MKHRNGFVRFLELGTLAAMLLCGCTSLIAHQQPPAVSRPSTSSVRATPRRTDSPYGSAANTATGLKLPAGTITGYVYWQMNVFQPQSDCQGLTVKVVTVTKSGMPLQLLSSSNTLTAMGPVTDNSASGTPKYMLCSYAFQNMPENVSLRALLYGQPTTASVALPSAFQIPGGNCNSTPSSTLSLILTGGPMLCGHGAFNINLKLVPSPSQLGKVPSDTGKPLLNSPLGNNGTMSPMLAPGSPSQSTDGGLLAHRAPSSISDGTRQGYAGPTHEAKAPPQSTGAFTGGVKPAGGNFSVPSSINPASPNNLTPSIPSGSFTPKMPPLQSNPKRDASPPADAATKAQIKSKLEAQLLAASQRTGGLASAASRPAEGNSPEIQALQRQIVFVNSLRTQGSLPNGVLIPGQAPNLVVRNQPATPSNPMLHAPQPTHMCPASQIHAVNGKNSGVVFTQDPAYNDYIITGCGFGTQGGQVYLSGAVTGGRINMIVKPNQWSDTQIEAVVEPGLAGVLDGWPDLIVVPSGGSLVKFPNCRFYAQRQSVLLPDIPQQYVTLANVTVGDSTHGLGTRYCPGPDLGHLFPCIAYNAGPPLDGITNGHDHRNDPNQLVSNAVDRDGGQLQFNAGEDVYDLSYMAPGFQIDYPTVYWYAWTSDVCEGWASDAFPKKPGDSVGYDTEGHYSWYKKTNTKIVVDWGVDHCAWRWLGVFRVDDWYNSGYSLQVYVKGPIGVDPWTGHPVSTSRGFGQAQPNRIVRVQ